MKTKNSIKNTATLSVLSALATVLLVLGGFFDVLDLACASVAALIINIVCNEYGHKNALLVFGVSALLSNKLLPFRTCPILFVAFFGYFPVLRNFLYNKIKFRRIVYILLLLLYNGVMVILYQLFKEIFGIANEPLSIIIGLLVSSNIFYVCFEMLLGRIMILYNYYIKRKVNKDKRY